MKDLTKIEKEMNDSGTDKKPKWDHIITAATTLLGGI